MNSVFCTFQHTHTHTHTHTSHSRTLASSRWSVSKAEPTLPSGLIRLYNYTGHRLKGTRHLSFQLIVRSCPPLFLRHLLFSKKIETFLPISFQIFVRDSNCPPYFLRSLVIQSQNLPLKLDC